MSTRHDPITRTGEHRRSLVAVWSLVLLVFSAVAISSETAPSFDTPLGSAEPESVRAIVPVSLADSGPAGSIRESSESLARSAFTRGLAGEWFTEDDLRLVESFRYLFPDELIERLHSRLTDDTLSRDHRSINSPLDDCASPFPEGAESAVVPGLPDCWVQIDADENSPIWVTSSGTAHSGTNKFSIGWNVPAIDDWLISPGVSLTGGIVYQLRFWRSAASFLYEERLDVWYGLTQDVMGMTECLAATYTFNTASYTQDVFTFIPASSGTYYIGWHGTSENAFGIYLDDLELIPAPSVADLSVSLLAPCGTVPPDPNQQVSLRITNNGGESSYPVTAQFDFDNGAALGTAAVPGLDPGSFYDVVFGNTVNLSAGEHILSGWFEPHDVPSANDSTSCAIVAQRPCPTCAPADANLDPINTQTYGQFISGDCGNGGKWVASFMAVAGNIYHFDLCPNAPGGGQASEDVDIKILNAGCTVLSGQDGLAACSPVPWLPNDFQWTAAVNGIFYVVIAPYPSHNAHVCTGTAATTFTLNYYREPPPPPPPNDLCENAAVLTVNGPPYCGTTVGATDQCPALPFNEVWHTFTLTGPTNIAVKYCGTTGGATLMLSLYGAGCCVAPAIQYDYVEYGTCPDGMVTAHFSRLPAGTYWLPIGFSMPRNYCVQVVAPFECACRWETNAACDTIGGLISDLRSRDFPLTVTQPYHVTDANVCLDLNHTSDSNLSISIISPSGTSVDLSSGNGGSGNNYTCTVFDDEAATPITAGTPPFNGVFRPEGFLSNFDGQNAFGRWILRVTDEVGGDFGNLDGACLLLEHDYLMIPSTVWVNAAWAAHVLGDVVEGHLYGYDAFRTLPEALASGADSIFIYPGTYPTGLVHIAAPLTVTALDMLAPRPLVTAAADGAAWFDIDAGIPVSFNHLAFEGSGHAITTCIWHRGAGFITDCEFSQIADLPGTYQGYAIDAHGGPLTVENCEFSDIFRVGVYFNDGMSGTIRGNTYTGKGPGDWLDYAFVIGGGSTALIENNTVSQCRGVASVYGSTSAGIYCWSDPGITSVTMHGNLVYGNSVGVAVDDAWSLTMWSDATITGNNLSNNPDQALRSVSHNLVEATANWWGEVNGPEPFIELTGRSHPQRRAGSIERRHALDDENDIIGILHYSPWVATDGTDDDPVMPGWQPDLSTVGVSTNGTIQEGVDLVSGSTVMITAGTYSRPIVIEGTYPNGILLQGPNSGINPCSDARFEEALIQTPGLDAFDIRSSHVTVDGLKLSNVLDGIVVSLAASDIVVRNCIVDSAANIGLNLWRAATAIIEHNQVTNCQVSGISGGDDAGTPEVEDDVPLQALVERNCLRHNGFAIAGYHNGSQIAHNSISGDSSDPSSAGISGQLLNTLIRGNSVSGYTASDAVSLISRSNRPNSSAVTVDSNLFTGNASGLHLADPATGLQVLDNVFANSTSNAYDINASTYSRNCWSDFSANSGFPFQYNVPGGDNTDLHPNVNGCGGVELAVSSPYVSCQPNCACDTLRVTFDGAGYITGQLFVQLAAELDAGWEPGNQYYDAMPVENAAEHLVFAAARRSAGNQIEINIQWEPPYSTGNASQFIACLPIRDASSTHCQSLTMVGAYSNFYDASGPHVNAFSVGAVDVQVDCEGPAATLSQTDSLSCDAYGSPLQLAGTLTPDILRGDSSCNSRLQRAYVEVNGNPAQQLSLFSEWGEGDFSTGTFPDAEAAVFLFGWLGEGCNELVVHAFDAACNEGLDTLTVIKDTVAPDLTVIQNPPAICLSDNANSPSYGGTALDDALDITTELGDSCVSTNGTLKISYWGNNFSLPLDVLDYPSADAEALALWNQIKTWVPGADGGSYDFSVEARDCADNSATGTFTLCLDLTAPQNTLIEFDARPTDEGVWLKWSWSYGAIQAAHMEVWRSAYLPGDFPNYPFPNPARWQVLSSNENYPQIYPPAGFTRVAAQDGISGTTAALYSGLNGKGNNLHSGPGLDYWKDEDALWVDESEHRGIYRYVTFVQDQAGNWSQLDGYTLNINADRATNYWLGDFSREVTISPDPSDGDVFTADLSLLSSVYFTPVPPAPGFFDIGPENAENGMGKGIPTPDGIVNYQDLIPFSFNFGMTGPGTFRLDQPSVTPFRELDVTPSIAITREEDRPLMVGDTFSVVVSIEGNEADAVKVAECGLEFDPFVLEVLEASHGEPEVRDGVPFSASKLIDGRNNAVGVAAAALGEEAVLVGDVDLATIRFRWKDERVSTTGVKIETYNLADGFGNVLSGTADDLTLEAHGAIPTRFALYQNYPNPFNPVTNIRFDLADGADVRLVIYNIMGQEVRTLTAQFMPAGAYNIIWDGLDNDAHMAGSGMYFYRISAGPLHDIKKMLLTR